MGVFSCHCCRGNEEVKVMAQDISVVEAPEQTKGASVGLHSSSSSNQRFRNDTQTDYEEAEVTENHEFWIILNRSGGASLGIAVSYLDGETLMIDGIAHEGLIKTWNDSHPPENMIHVGDHFIEINGKSGSAFDLLEECKSEQLKIKVWSRKMADASVNPAGPAAGA